ncbi:MAG: hypothetical protein IJ455_00445 [Agathobacter sp.]|nr:hypothetical protein [Agathobacter sp.]
MKKSFVLLLTLVILFSGTACYAQKEILKEKDQVHFTEKVLYGDKAVVEGVTVEMKAEYSSNLYWDSTYVIGAEPKEETEYRFYPWDYSTNAYSYSGSMDFVVDCTDTVGLGYDYQGDENYYGLHAAMKELYDQTEPGTENSITVYMKDYVDYYTFGLSLHLPENSENKTADYYRYTYLWKYEVLEEIAQLEKQGSNKEEVEQMKAYLADLETFQEFFKIPVLDKEVYTLAMSKDSEGNIIGIADSHMHGGSGTGEIEIPEAPNVAGADSFGFRVFSAFDDGDCYFTFDPHTYNEQLVDVSQIPGGYGIYHFTYNEKDGSIDLDDLKMVYPLDVNSKWESMQLDASGKNLLLLTLDEEKYYLSVIDRETMTLVDKFNLGNSESYLSHWSYEDYLVICGENLMVFPMDENGRYFQAFSVNTESINEKITPNTENDGIFRTYSKYDWNGETLLVASNIQYYDEDYGRALFTCDFYLAAIDETGLLYYGEYNSTLDEPCRPNDEYESPVNVRWK